MSPAPAAELEGAVVRFGARRALDGVSLRLAAGERVALVGPSGAGKSTLLALLGGALAPTEGSVRVLGEDLARLGPRARRRVQRQIGTVHQGLHLVGPLRAGHNVDGGRLGTWPLWRAAAALARPSGSAEAAAALAQVGLAGRERERTERLSGGEQQRVAVARLLVGRPRLALADEPVAHLDRERAQAVLDALLAVAGATLVVALHDVRLARARCSRIVGLREGRVAFDVPAGAVREDDLTRLYALEAGR